MLTLTPDRIFFEQGSEILTWAITDSESSELISIIGEVGRIVDQSMESDIMNEAIYSMNGPIIRITDRVVEVEQSQGNTAALPFKQELAVPLEELEDLISEMKRDK